MLQRFSTRLISGECFLYKIRQVFFCTISGWPWLRVHAGAPSWTNVMWRLELNNFFCLLFHSHFCGEGQASPLSLICCWCSNRLSKSVLGVKNVSQWDRSLSFRPIWSILNWYAGGTWLSWVGFCTLCFCFPTKMLHLNAPFFPLKCSVSPKKSLKCSDNAHYTNGFF